MGRGGGSKNSLYVFSLLQAETKKEGQVPAPACHGPRPTFSKTKGSSFQTGLMELVLGDSLVR